MLYATTTPADKRIAFRAGLASGTIQRFPGAFNPLSAKLIQEKGFDGVYISGAVLSADLGLPDIGLTTLTEVAGRSQQIARMTDLPAIVDADTGFGEPMNVARTIQELENAGLAGCHIEDQFNPKRCGHLDGKNMVDLDTAVKRIAAAADARRDPNFLIMARTDIRAVEGLQVAIDRAKALVDAGADAIFPEAMKSVAECAVIGIADALKGQKAVGYVVLKSGVELAPEELQKELVALVRREIGPVADFKSTVVVEALPKTRSGKILRKTMRQIADGESYTVPSTIEDPAVIDALMPLLRSK